jgi:hypothetical protein
VPWGFYPNPFASRIPDDPRRKKWFFVLTNCMSGGILQSNELP